MKKKVLKKIALAFCPIFLMLFMLLLFGPSEIFFANATEFLFIYSDFAIHMAIIAFVSSCLLACLTALLPERVFNMVTSFVFALSLAGYIQVMFLNKNLDLLGLNPNGYQTDQGRLIVNTIIWVMILIICMILTIWKKEIANKIVVYASCFLISIQAVALVSLLVSANDNAYKRQEGNWYLSGENQFTVSSQKNVIVIILDYFSNQYVEPILQQYPDAMDCLQDFTYYSNADCTFFGTFPSLPHMLTGSHQDPKMGMNEWCNSIWESDDTVDFYQMLNEKNYKVNLYTPETSILLGQNDINLLKGKFSNLTNTAQDVEVNTNLLLITLSKMSVYRMAPEITKSLFYTNMNEYTDIVTYKSNGMTHNNYHFYEVMQEEGLKVDDTSNYVVIQHLMGMHQFTMDENGYYKQDSSMEETGKGCMVVLGDYLNRLKELGYMIVQQL